MTAAYADAPSSDVAALQRRIAKLERINGALMSQVERATNQHEGAYSLFQTAIMLEGRVRSRTEELTALMHSLERSNAALTSAKEEAEKANRSKTKFLAAASHDLLQPLNAARLSSSALLDLGLNEEAHVIARQVVRGLQTIEDLIKTLLDISKLDAGIVHPLKKPVAIRSVFAEIEDSCRGLAEKKGLRLVVRCPDIAVQTDLVLLRRVVSNLVSNGLRYTERGGVLVAGRVRGERCWLDIVDSGPGIAEDERDLVFEEFYRGRTSGQPEAGLGLGLSIVRRMVAALGHQLEFWSRVGHGTRFRLSLPVSREAPTEGMSFASADSFLEDADIVVVENDRATLTALTRLLLSWGLRVTACTGIEDWRQNRSARRPDLVIADYHLDDGAIGLDVIAAIRAETGADLAAVVVTADHSDAVEALAIEARCELLRKPVKPAQLRSLLSFLIAEPARAAPRPAPKAQKPPPGSGSGSLRT